MAVCFQDTSEIDLGEGGVTFDFCLVHEVFMAHASCTFVRRSSMADSYRFAACWGDGLDGALSRGSSF